MARKKPGIPGSLWNAWVWLVSSILHVIYVSARWLFNWLSSALVAVGRGSNDAAKRASRPAIRAEGIPLEQIRSRKGSLAAFEEKIYSSKSTIGLVLGARGSGKSALGMRLLENIAAKKTRQVYAMGFEQSALPAWVSCTGELGSIPNGAFVLVDEGGIAFSSRQSMSGANKLLSSLILIARHKDISVLFISQNSSNLEINAIRQSDYLLLRKPSLLQMDFERKKIGEIYSRIASGFETLPEKGRHATYVYSDEFEGFVANRLPSFWSQKASKPFSSFKAEQEGKEK
ncbi:MAG: hypothetical protein WC717_00415 [Candidatus Micrarchaeia archaeon]|jgi:hypothetical protein